MLLLRRLERNVDASNKKESSALLSHAFSSDDFWTPRSRGARNLTHIK